MEKEKLPGMSEQAEPGAMAAMPATPPAEMPAAPMPEESAAAPESNTKAAIQAIIDKYFPGSNMPQDEAVLDLLTKLDNIQEKFIVAIENDPDFGAALDEIFKGGEARVAIARAYGPDAFTAVEGDPDFDQMSEAFNQGRDKISKKREASETLRKNQEMSMKEIEAFIADKGYGEEEVIARLKLMTEIKDDFLNDKLTRKHLDLLDKAMDYDTAVQQAEEAGKVAGRNEKIVGQKEREKLSTDGLPKLTSKAPPATPERKKGLLESLATEEEMY
jgi:hypothetical protein